MATAAAKRLRPSSKGMTTVVAAAALSVATTATKISAAPLRVVLDTDIGTDFDDAWALMYLLARPDVFDVALVQVSTFNTTQRAQIAASMIAAVGRAADVPIAVGEYTGPQLEPQYWVAANYTLDDYVAAGGRVSWGVGAFEALVADATPDNPLYILEIAPATSLAAVLAANPAGAASCVVVAMSGSVTRGYFNSTTITHEYNVATDIPASVAMYAANWAAPMLTAPLDTTDFMQFGGATYAALLAANNSAHTYVSTLLANYVAWYEGGGSKFAAMLPFSPTTGTDTLYDLQAAWMLPQYAAAVAAGGGAPSIPLLATPSYHLAVNATGYTVPNASAPLAYVATAFTQPPYTAVDSIGAEVIAYLIAAG